MKTLFFILGFLATSYAASSHRAAHLGDLQLTKKFNDFAKEYNKKYSSPAHYEERLAIFAENWKMIQEHNLGKHSWKMAINQFADLTQQEFKSTYASGHLNLVRPGAGADSAVPKATKFKDLPDSKDWRDDGVITAPKDQGGCGSCWAFATVEQLESYLALETGNDVIELSAQQITSCTPNPLQCGGTGGCSGSIPQMGFSYTQMMGIVTEEEYPYVARTGTCQYDAENTVASAYVRGYASLPHNDLDATMNHLANVGPLSMSGDASHWSFYSHGVFDSCSYDSNIEIDHAIQLVGYGTDPTDGPYWLVRNSWGGSWGEKGYIRLKREAEAVCGTDSTPMMGTGCKDDGNSVQKVCGMCGALFDNTYPIGTDTLSGVKP